MFEDVKHVEDFSDLKSGNQYAVFRYFWDRQKRKYVTDESVILTGLLRSSRINNDIYFFIDGAEKYMLQDDSWIKDEETLYVTAITRESFQFRLPMQV